MYRVLIDDNFDFYDEGERDVHGTYASYEEALSVARDLVDRSLGHLYRPGMTAEELWTMYTDFGDDPFISPEDAESRFSAWEYARERTPGILDEKGTRTRE